ncbi:hypothetical protein U5922_014535 [Aquicoccus sp. G2-2]|uniref:hypothetical protein n=1 Tax=Aquicoccus sp. G2-2 TaxID=3092120 RepID=UPI002ADF867D|nr:hypothetical protein [Aquicoccus sp. G2-2]MEA1114614.1 hypothetical protein [Aquicoccus sp. G2-2]
MADRVFVPGQDDAAVLDLRARVWGADHPHNDPAFFKWLFRDSPSGSGTGIVFEKDGRLIGFAGICARDAEMGDQMIRISHGLDFMVDPAVSGVLSGRVGVKVLQRHVEEASEKGFDVNLNYPNANSHRMLLSKRVKYDPVFTPDLFIRPLASAFRGPGLSVARRAALGAGAIYARLRSIGIKSSAAIFEIDTFDSRFDALWPRIKADGLLRFRRDAATLTWRFRQNPIYRYRILAAARNGRLDGFIVTSRREIFGLPTELICDLAVANDARGTATELIHAATKRAQRDGNALLGAQANIFDQVCTSLARCGFIRVPQRFNPKPFRMIATANTENGKLAMQGNNWAFAWGDMDVV